MKYKTTAPCRIDLAGGTLDIQPIYLFLPEACTVNLAISIGAEVEVEEIPGEISYVNLEDLGISFKLSLKENYPLPKGAELIAVIIRHFLNRGLAAVRVNTKSYSPPGAGLAASSTLCVALTATLAKITGLETTTNSFVQLCLDLEATILGTPAGYQDFYPAYKGGVQEIRFYPGEIRNSAVSADLSEISRKISLVYTGKPHHSGLNNWQVFKAVIDGDKKVINCLSEIGYIASQMSGALQSGDWSAVSRLLGKEWEQRKCLSDVVSTPAIDALVKEAKSLGGSGKVCGAGGGGCMILCHDGEENTINKLAEKAEKVGAVILPWSPSSQGCVITTVV